MGVVPVPSVVSLDRRVEHVQARGIPESVVRVGCLWGRGDHVAHGAANARSRALNGHKGAVCFDHQVCVESI